MMEEMAELNEAVKSGLRRAGVHWARAAYELMAGLGAFLDELADAGKDTPVESEKDGPTRIDVE